MKTTIKQIQSGEAQNYNYVETKRFEIEAETQDDLLALYFSKYVNAYKYCNDISFKLADEAMQEAYNVWISSVSNYANNGGDMW